MAWAYCYNKDCGRPLKKPTIKQIADDDYKCPDCGEHISTHTTLGEVLEDLEERIKELESKIGEDM